MQTINRLWTKPLGSFARYALRAYLVGVASLAMAPAMADTATFDIPAEPMAAALKAFASQSHMQLLFKVETVANAHSNAISGELDKHEALQRLLLNSGLEAAYSSDNAATIRPVNTKADQRPAAAHPQEGLTRFNIPAESLAQALEEFATQSDLSVDAPSDLVAGKKSNVIQGSMASTEALGRLLKGSGLFFTREDDGSVTIHGKPEQSATGPSLTAVGPGQSAEDRTGLAEILVKGSRIMNVDVTRTEDDAQPYYIFDSQQIERSGATNVDDFLKQMLTMNTTFQSNYQGNAQYSGSLTPTVSSINLRGLGTNETLILVDGRRSANVSFNGSSTQPDINGIPLASIERIEVLPSSASAIYGGAAVGGVVNIILKKNFNGGEVGYSRDDTFSGRSPRQTVNAVYGFSLDDNKTRVMLSANYSDGKPLLLQDRLNLVGRGVSTILQNEPSYFYNPTSPFPGATPNIAGVDSNGNPANLILRNGTPLNSSFTFVPAGAAPSSNITAGLLGNAGHYNLNLPQGNQEYGLQDQFGIVPTVKSFMATIRHEFNDSFEIFTEFSTLSNSSHTNYNPFGSGGYPVPASAPDNPFQESLLVSFPFNFSAPYTNDSTTKSVTVGLLAHLGAGWRSELDYTWSGNIVSFSQPQPDYNDVNAALANGTINPFVDTIAHPPALGSYLGIASNSVESTLNDLAVRVSGPVGSLPWGTPTLTVGLEHRKEGYGTSTTAYLYPDSPSSNYGYIDYGQSQDTNSIYAEANIPLVTVKNAPPGIRSLDLQLAGRLERYTVFASTANGYLFWGGATNAPLARDTIVYTSSNPTIALKYRPVEDLTLRVSYAKAFLPPTAVELLPNPILQCIPSPCQMITDPRNGQSYNVNYTGGGNPDLQPQRSKDWDFGLIWEPQEEYLKGTRIDIEHYSIVQPNYITGPTAQQVVSDPALSGRVTRDPITGLVTVVNLSTLNATEYKTKGWDLTLGYQKATRVGTFDVRAVATIIDYDLRQNAIDTPFFNYAGYPADGGEAKVKGNLTLKWAYRQWDLGWSTTYVGGYYQFDAPGSPYYLQFGGTFSNVPGAQGTNTIPHQVYHNAFGTYTFGKTPIDGGSPIANGILSNLRIQFGIKNVFNTLPPFDADLQPYFYSPYGDPRLRSYWLTIKKSFGG